MQVTNETTDYEFKQAVRNGVVTFVDTPRRKVFSILNRDTEEAVINTDENTIKTSSTVHAIARFFSLWQNGELL